MLVALVALGVLQAAAGLSMAELVNGLLREPATVGAQPDPAGAWVRIAMLAGCVLAIGAARWGERVVAEALGQDYVFEQRRRLIASSLLGTRGNPSLGVTVTRASNDLTAVRNWIAQGIVPLVTGVPLVAVIVGTLVVTNWPVAVVVAVPLLVAAALLPGLSSLAFDRARRLRRRRGGMSAHIADTVRAGESVRVSGAARRELNAVDRNSSKVVAAAVDRARVTGAIRALMITAGSLGTAGVVVLAVLGTIDAASVAAALTLIGVMSTPLADLGRVIEYRQNYRAARRILAPMLDEARQLKRAERERERRRRDADDVDVPGHRGLSIRRRRNDQPAIVPELDARPGDRVLVSSAHPDRVREALRILLSSDTASTTPEARPLVVVEGIDYGEAPARLRRRLVGLASGRVPLERGSVGRLAGYRSPDAEPGEIDEVLQWVGLGERLRSCDEGIDTTLKNDGAPWPPADVAKLKLARAVLGTPPLLVIEDLDAHLDDDGVRRLQAVMHDYPGVVVFSSRHPERLCREYRAWSVGDLPLAEAPRLGGDDGGDGSSDDE